ncbi:MAG TPA: GTP 3',8-cyclase MoaA [Candidatus Saccharimonadia bacterium]|nr:GTP 3',8-cyclase MoaA [Candidatus Saccharimonadia bacterium]
MPQDRLARPLRDLRISVIDRCNYRCPYCMPESRYPRDHAFLASRERLTAGEIERLARIFVRLGVRKLRLTGGEPLLRADLPDIVARLAAIEGADDLALTTNGTLLSQTIGALVEAGLARVTVSLDALDAPTFSLMSGGRGRVEDVLAGIDAAAAAGVRSIKINTVVVRGRNEHAPLEILAHFRGSGHVVRFIEYMDVGTCNDWRREDVVTSAELIERIGAVWPLEPRARAYRGEVASRYAYVDGAGEIGFVSSISAPFCGDCSRARVSADGRLYTCLFATDGLDLRTPLRGGASDAELEAAIASAWSARVDRYSEIRAGLDPPAPRKRIEMYTIGG